MPATNSTYNTEKSVNRIDLKNNPRKMVADKIKQQSINRYDKLEITYHSNRNFIT